MGHSSGGAGKDIRVVGAKVSAWVERKGHRLTESMITGVYDVGIEVLFIGTGVNQALECPRKVQDAILAQGIGRVVLEPAPQACRTYHALYRQGVKVALFAHGTS
ncbi:MAG: MTH938/NDUFAF3 family protein [Anaerolineae bacterium]